MTHHPTIEALVALGPELKRLHKDSTGDPWELRERFLPNDDPFEIIGNIDGDADDEGRLRMICTEVALIADNADAEANTGFVIFVKNNMKTILAAIEHLSSVPEGWVMVPKEATPEMVKAAYARDHDGTTRLYFKIWEAMLAASPYGSIGSDYSERTGFAEPVASPLQSTPTAGGE